MNRHILISLSLSIVLSACTGSSDSDIDTSSETNVFALSSLVMEDGGNLPVTYTCDGDNTSPPISWSGAPDGTSEYALVMDHIPGSGDFSWYWIMYSVGADVSALDAGEVQGMLGTNSVNGLTEYAPPCSKGLAKSCIRLHFTLCLNHLI